MNKVEPVMRDGKIDGYVFECPGCEAPHYVYVEGPVKWSFNGNLKTPTFSPSILVSWEDQHGKNACHSFVKDGNIQFLSDCTHALAGKTISLSEVAN